MSKYTREELRSMARQLLAAREAGDIRALAVLQLLMNKTGCNLAQCITNIQTLAND